MFVSGGTLLKTGPLNHQADTSTEGVDKVCYSFSLVQLPFSMAATCCNKHRGWLLKYTSVLAQVFQAFWGLPVAVLSAVDC